MYKKPGERGYLPSRSVPTRRRAERNVTYEAQDSGISRPPVNADLVVRENFNEYDYIEKFPHGYDPFTEGETALRKKVEFRPNKYQIDAVINRKKSKMTYIHAGESGQGPVKHEKKFISKNSTYLEMKVNPLAEGPVKHEIPVLDKNSEVVPVQTSAIYDYNPELELNVETSNHKRHVETPSVYSFQDGFNFVLAMDRSDTTQSQRRNHIPIHEEVKSRILVAQTINSKDTTDKKNKTNRANTVPEYTNSKIVTSTKSEHERAKVRTKKYVETPNYNTYEDYEDEYQPSAYDKNSVKHGPKFTQSSHDKNYSMTEYDNEIADSHNYDKESTVNRKPQSSKPKNKHSHNTYDVSSIRVLNPNDRISSKSNNREESSKYSNVEVFNESTRSKPNYSKSRHRKDQVEDKSNHKNYNTSNYNMDISSQDKNIEMHRQRQNEKSTLETNASFNVDTDTRDISRMPNMKPKYRSKQTGHFVTMKIPDTDVRTRINMALDRSKRQEQADNNSSHYAELQIDNTKINNSQNNNISNRRQYSAKQDNEQTYISGKEVRTERDYNIEKNHKESSLTVNLETTPIGNSTAKDYSNYDKRIAKQTVDQSGVKTESKVNNPISKDIGIDPILIEDHKQYVAREKNVMSGIDATINDGDMDREGIAPVVKTRELIINPEIKTGGNHTIVIKNNPFK